jgi:hypothetical protein
MIWVHYTGLCKIVAYYFGQGNFIYYCVLFTALCIVGCILLSAFLV